LRAIFLAVGGVGSAVRCEPVATIDRESSAELFLTYKSLVLIDFILRPIRRNFGKDRRFYAAVDDMFGFIPHNIELYKLALIHKSASIVLADGQHINNERLEFLGDAVLECVSSDYLFIEYPDKNEGFLTKLRSKMVSRQMLNEVAKRIGMDQYVITHSSNNLSQKHIYGDAFEAMMGAIYLDQGYDFVNRLLINKIFVDYIKVDQLTQAETDFKSRLIEWCQKNHHTIHFDTANDKHYSSAHPFFYSKVIIDNIEMGYGAGESKKEAEQRAAYSVSQGFNDDDCTKLLDKLDDLDARDAKSKSHSARQPKVELKVEVEIGKEQRREPKQKPKQEPKAEPAVEVSEQPKSEAKSEPKAEVKAELTAEGGEVVAKKSRRNRKPAAKPAVTETPATEEVKVEAKPAEVVADEVVAAPAEEQQESAQKPARRRQSSRRKSGAAKKESAEVDSVNHSENAPAEVKIETKTEAEPKSDSEPAKSVKKSPRRRSKPKAKQAAEQAAEQASAPASVPAPGVE
jgi:ribonuclease-3